MNSQKRTICILLMVILVLVGCKTKPTPSAPEDTGDETTGEEGWATLLYEFSDLQENVWALSVRAEVPVIIERGKENPEKFVVHGSRGTTYYTQIQTLNPDYTPCFVNCDFPMDFYFEGELARVFDENNKVNCQFRLKNDYTYDVKDVKRYGNCPFNMVEIFDCAGAFLISGGPPTNDWVFDKNNRVITPPMGPGQTLRAEITVTEWPEDMEDVCKWDK